MKKLQLSVHERLPDNQLSPLLAFLKVSIVEICQNLIKTE